MLAYASTKISELVQYLHPRQHASVRYLSATCQTEYTSARHSMITHRASHPSPTQRRCGRALAKPVSTWYHISIRSALERRDPPHQHVEYDDMETIEAISKRNSALTSSNSDGALKIYLTKRLSHVYQYVLRFVTYQQTWVASVVWVLFWVTLGCLETHRAVLITHKARCSGNTGAAP